MAIFHGYVSLPEGNSFFSCPTFCNRNPPSPLPTKMPRPRHSLGSKLLIDHHQTPSHCSWPPSRKCRIDRSHVPDSRTALGSCEHRACRSSAWSYLDGITGRLLELFFFEQTFSDGEALPCRVGVYTVHSGLIRPGCLLEGSFPATAIFS